MDPAQIYMFYKVKKHWVFVSSWIAGTKLKISINELA